MITVNGKTGAGWRLDEVTEDGPVGMEMLMNPFAIVPKKENADRIVAAFDAMENKGKGANEVIAQAIVDATNAEAKRWCDRLEVLPVVCNQDGSGTDTGDSLDVIEAEINLATGKLTDALEELVSAVKDGLKRHAAGDQNAIASDMIRATLAQAEELLEKCGD